MTAKNGKVKTNESRHDDLFLKKHVGLIHCENKLTLIQRKICNILLFNALDKINKQDIHEISIKQLCSLVGYNSNDSKLIKDAIRGLISVVMEWNLLEDTKFLNEENYPEDAITWNASSLLAGATIRSGVIQYSYSPQMKSVLSSLDIYGRINLFVQAKFNSSYSLVLYENCIRFKNIKQTSWMSIELFRSLMGVPEGKYSSFKEFKRNVINVAVSEVNQKADIHIEPQFRKSGRTITGIQFVLSDNENYQPAFKRVVRMPTDVPNAQQQSTLLEILMSQFELSQKQAVDVTAQYEAEYIQQKMKMVKVKKNVKHLGAYLLSALRMDYQANERKPKESLIKTAEPTYQREAKAASEIASLRNQYLRYKQGKYEEFVNAETVSKIKEINESFEKFISPNKEIFKFYKKSGLKSPFVMGDFIEFIDKQYPEILGEYLDFEGFLSSEEGGLESIPALSEKQACGWIMKKS